MGGTKVNGVHVGNNVAASVFSFQAVKNLPTADSGMVCFAEAECDAIARKLSWLGIDKDTFDRASSGDAYKWRYDVAQVGYKYHGNSIVAAMALVGLKYLDADNQYRRELAGRYIGLLDGNEKLHVVKHEGCESSRHLFQVILEDRETVIGALNKLGINPGVHYRDNREYAPFHKFAGDCPNCEKLSTQVLSLPLHLQVSPDDVKFIAESLLDII